MLGRGWAAHNEMTFLPCMATTHPAAKPGAVTHICGLRGGWSRGILSNLWGSFQILIHIFVVRSSTNMWLCVFVRWFVSFRFVKKNFCLNDQAYNCLIHFYSELKWKTNFDGRHPLMEDDLWWKMTFDRRRPLMEDDLWRKTTFDGRRPLMEDDLWRKTTFDRRRPLMEEDLWQKRTFDGRRPSMEYDLWWKTTFDGKQYQ